ncbi:MAG: HDOD domain-containing protein [Phycisphaerales bacterium]|nr:HDOD domain-containing protein [Phycisphaerales bacterium]
MLTPALESVLSNPVLPSLPTVALEVLELTSRSDVNLREIERAIERDQAISARVLRMVNSSYYGLSTRCGNIHQALAFLGLETVKSLVLGFSLVKTVEAGEEDEVTFDFPDYWRRSFFCASTARAFAEALRNQVRVDPDEAFMAALIQDIGMVALWRVHGDRYLQIVDMAGVDHHGVTVTERRTLEIDHAEVGAEMARRWRFPNSIVSAIASHHHPFSGMTEHDALARIVRLAGAAASMIDRRIKSPRSSLQRFERQVTSWFKMKPVEIRDALEVATKRAEELAGSLDIDAGSMPSIDEILLLADEARGGMLNAMPPETEDQADDLDELTGLPGRSRLVTDLETAFSSCGGTGSVALFLVGLDDVRALNERLGDTGGDSALAHVAGCVKEFTASCRGRVGAYRFVGAEIAVIFEGVDTSTALVMAEELRLDIACRPARIESRNGDSEFSSIHVTIGVGLHGAGRLTITSPDGLLRAAMCAVTAGRRLGGDRVEFHHDESAFDEDHVEVA